MVSSTPFSSKRGERVYEEGNAGTEIDRNDDPLITYRENEPMTPAKIKEHEPTAVKYDWTDLKIVEFGEEGPNPKQAREIARRSGMAKGMAGAFPTGDTYEQGAAGSDVQLMKEMDSGSSKKIMQKRQQQQPEELEAVGMA